MNIYDSQKAARVWQRVQAKEETSQPQKPREEQIPALIMEEWLAATTYLRLSRQLPSKQAAVLQRLSREEQTHVSCLKGIYTLMTGNKPIIQTPPVTKEPAEIALRRCYGREMHSLAEYEARSSDPEYGPVFSRLAQQEREHCKTLLELIGSLAKQ